MKSTEELIGEIRGLASGKISNSELQRIVEEARGHLDASVQARLELGVDAPTATSEAVHAFGSPEQFVASMIRRHPMRRNSWFDGKVTVALVSTTLFFALTIFGSTWSAYTIPLICSIAAFGFAAWIFLASWRCKRPQVLPSLANILLAIPLFCFAWSFGDVPDRDFSLTIGPSRIEVARQLAEINKRMAATNEAQLRFEAMAKQYFYSPAAEQPPMEPVFEMGAEGVVKGMAVSPSRSSDWARERWEEQIPLAYKQFAEQRQAIAADSENLREKLDRPLWLNAFYHLSTGLLFAGAWGGIMALISLGAWLIRETIEAIKRYRRPATLA